VLENWLLVINPKVLLVGSKLESVVDGSLLVADPKALLVGCELD